MIKRAKPIGAWALIVLGMAVAGCDTVPLTAPTNSTVTLTTSATVVPTGGTADVTAFVAEPSGNPVQNGTMVRFTTNLGSVDPVEVQTRNGLAVTTFHAGTVSGVAEVRATSGSAGGGTTPVKVDITVGAAAVAAVTLRANPASVPFNGGTVELIATVTDKDGRLLSNVSVNFSSSDGQLGALAVLTDASGEARTTLTTSRTTKVTATAGAKTSNEVTVTRQDPPPTPNVTLAATSEAATHQGQRWTFIASVTGISTSDPTQFPSRFDWDFGDGVTLTTNGNTTSHIYTTGGVVRTVSVRVTLANGQTASTATDILIAVLP